MFSNLCTVHADTSRVAKTLSPRRGFAGMQFFRQQFSIVLMFGLTELEAQISWKEDVSHLLWCTVCKLNHMRTTGRREEVRSQLAFAS